MYLEMAPQVYDINNIIRQDVRYCLNVAYTVNERTNPDVYPVTVHNLSSSDNHWEDTSAAGKAVLPSGNGNHSPVLQA